MTTLRRWTVMTLLAMAGACGDDGQSPADAPGADAANAAVERGRYLVNTVGGCTFCHTPLLPDGTRDMTRLLAGVDCAFDLDPSDDQAGCISIRNLTNHPTGLANATDEQIKRAIKDGIRTDGKYLSPGMPYWIYHNMTDEDVEAVVAYLRTVPGVDHTVRPNQPPWSDWNNDGPLAEFIDPADIPMPAAGPDQESAMRGRYLAGMAGLCIDCHTPDRIVDGVFQLFPQPIDTSRTWAGGRNFPKHDLGLVAPGFEYPDVIATRNLTPHATGLEGWTIDQIKAAIAEGKDPEGKAVCAAMHGSMISPYAALAPQDLDDIANYLASLPPVANETGDNCQGPTVP